MSAAAKPTERLDRDLGVLQRDGDHIDLRLAKQIIEISAACFAISAFDNQGQLDARYRSH